MCLKIVTYKECFNSKCVIEILDIHQLFLKNILIVINANIILSSNLRLQMGQMTIINLTKGVKMNTFKLSQIFQHKIYSPIAQ
jgi:hypothetical protein